jgi:gamma-glutamylcyclotransferase
MRLQTPRAVKRVRLAVVLAVWPLARLWYGVHGFRLGGRPGEQIWYFAYGANMHDSAFRDRRGMRPDEWRAGRIRGYRLRFNLDGRPKGKSAPANIVGDPGLEVWGVLYRITRRDLVRLNASEGIPGRRYRPIELAAEDAAGNRLQAVAYIADGNDEDGNPSLRYLTLLREGAREHGLPAHWIALLDSVRHWE